jgi:hypothetical protein
MKKFKPGTKVRVILKNSKRMSEDVLTILSDKQAYELNYELYENITTSATWMECDEHRYFLKIPPNAKSLPTKNMIMSWSYESRLVLEGKTTKVLYGFE